MIRIGKHWCHIAKLPVSMARPKSPRSVLAVSAAIVWGYGPVKPSSSNFGKRGNYDTTSASTCHFRGSGMAGAELGARHVLSATLIRTGRGPCAALREDERVRHAYLGGGVSMAKGP